MCIHLFFPGKWPIVSLNNKTIPRLRSCRGLWSCIFDLAIVGQHWSPLFGENILECFPKKTSFLYDWRKKDMNILDDTGVSKLSGNFYSGSGLGRDTIICKSWIWGCQTNFNIEKIAFKVVQMKFLAMHITNQKLRFDIFTVGNYLQGTWSLLNIIIMLEKLKTNWSFWPIQCIVGYCYKYTRAT